MRCAFTRRLGLSQDQIHRHLASIFPMPGALQPVPHQTQPPSGEQISDLMHEAIIVDQYENQQAFHKSLSAPQIAELKEVAARYAKQLGWRVARILAAEPKLEAAAAKKKRHDDQIGADLKAQKDFEDSIYKISGPAACQAINTAMQNFTAAKPREELYRAGLLFEAGAKDEACNIIKKFIGLYEAVRTSTLDCSNSVAKLKSPYAEALSIKILNNATMINDQKQSIVVEANGYQCDGGAE